MESRKIGIIGIQGRYGTWLKRFFEQRGCPVIGSDLNTEVTNQTVVETSDVVIFSVPIDQAAEIISSLTQFSRENQLWMDVTSLKRPAVDAMLRSRAEVVGLHPMCAPTVKTWRGQTVVQCAARLSFQWSGWVADFLCASEATIKPSTPDDHDCYMAVVQGLPHAAHLVMAALIGRMGIDVSESMSYTSPLYRIAFSLMGRILSQDAALYAGIQMQNSCILPMLDALVEEIESFRRVVRDNDKTAFMAGFAASRAYFGQKHVDEASKFFDNLIKLMADLSDDNMLVLDVLHDQSGLAHRITGMFAAQAINLTFFHSQKIGERKFRFLVGFDRPKSSAEIQVVYGMIGALAGFEIIS